MSGSRYEVVSQTVEVLFSPGTAQFEVPPFQRTYSWGAEEINQLIDDVFSEQPGNGLPYFLGSIVLAGGRSTGDYNPDIILDGQQRLTTVSLLIAALVRKLQENGATDVHEFNAYLFSRRIRGKRRPKIALQGDDQRIYEALIDDPSLHEDSRYKHTAIGASLAKIYRAIEAYASRAIQSSQSQHSPYHYYETMLERLLYDVEIVRITAPTENDAFRLFETLNDRGLALSAADLIKNKLFAQSGAEMEDAADAWSHMIMLTRDDDVVSFLRSYWIATRDFVRKRNLYDKYKNHINTFDATEATLFALELEEAAKDYEQIVNPNPRSSSWGTDVADALQRLTIYGAKSFRPAILACARFRPDEVSTLVEVCESITVRYSVVGEKNPNRLEVIYSEMCKAMRDTRLTLGEAFSQPPMSEYLKEIPSDAEFHRSVEYAEIGSVSSAWREILVRLNSALGTGETRIESAMRVHVEHILPQNPRATVLTEANVSMEQAAGLIPRIGNLTLLSGRKNREASNKPFSLKRDGYRSSEISMTQNLQHFDSWGQQEVEDRSKEFADAARELYRHPSQIVG